MRKRIRRVGKFASQHPLYVAAICVLFVEVVAVVVLLGDHFGDFTLALIDFFF